ncbi:hypothetical protein [Pontiella agarivorans]|uniref:DUF4180 domain-containing protein n=1 Tax=Pontiella agarivorans TaxID=3038953 RepID=A0ABU5MW23_9BACT|nr:hypothetical protein [Pontiella agarivorans]MDZ8118291.1 hypothetical protein [Pontiella agarivorans]
MQNIKTVKDGQFNLHFETRNNYLFVRLTGEDSYEASRSYWRQIADRVRKLELNRVLIHEALDGGITEGELFELIMEFVPASAGIRVALYDENKENHELNQLGELIARNRGAEIRIFQSLENAEKWISEN